MMVEGQQTDGPAPDNTPLTWHACSLQLSEAYELPVDAVEKIVS